MITSHDIIFWIRENTMILIKRRLGKFDYFRSTRTKINKKFMINDS